jgi:cytochrome c
MNKLSIVASLCCLAAAPALAQDPAAGEATFRQCQTCHVVANAEGTVLAGRNAKTGPNLYGVIGRQAGTVPDFAYGEDLVKAGAAGLVWDEASFIAYVQDPAAFLQEKLGDPSARSKMIFKVRSEEDAANLAAFIASLE